MRVVAEALDVLQRPQCDLAGQPRVAGVLLEQHDGAGRVQAQRDPLRVPRAGVQDRRRVVEDVGGALPEVQAEVRAAQPQLQLALDRTAPLRRSQAAFDPRQPLLRLPTEPRDQVGGAHADAHDDDVLRVQCQDPLVVGDGV